MRLMEPASDVDRSFRFYCRSDERSTGTRDRPKDAPFLNTARTAAKKNANRARMAHSEVLSRAIMFEDLYDALSLIVVSLLMRAEEFGSARRYGFVIVQVILASILSMGEFRAY